MRPLPSYTHCKAVATYQIDLALTGIKQEYNIEIVYTIILSQINDIYTHFSTGFTQIQHRYLLNNHEMSVLIYRMMAQSQLKTC